MRETSFEVPQSEAPPAIMIYCDGDFVVVVVIEVVVVGVVAVVVVLVVVVVIRRSCKR